MKSFSIRVFVLTLAVTGIAATSAAKASTPKHVVAFSEPSAPAPLCSPRGTSTCGID